MCGHVFMLQVKMPPMMEIITAEQLMEYLGERLFLLNLLHENKLMPRFFEEVLAIIGQFTMKRQT